MRFVLLEALCLEVTRAGWTSGEILHADNDYVLDGGTVLEETVAGNIVSCIGQCSRNKWCGSVNFHRPSTTCRIYADYQVEKALTPSSGWVLLASKVSREGVGVHI